MRRLGLVVGVVVLAGCAASSGPLDRDELLELARTRGDALGVAHSGTWSLSLGEVSCDCPDVGSFDTCTAATLGRPNSVDVVEADGLLTLRFSAVGAEYSGPLDDDGSFALALVGHVGGIAVRFDYLSRIDGEFEGRAGLEEFTTAVATRIRGDIDLVFDGGTTVQSVDCFASYALDGTRL